MTFSPHPSNGCSATDMLQALDRICGAAALMPGEDRDAYNDLRLMLLQEVPPGDVVALLQAQHLADLHWDEFRRRGCAASLIRSAMASAIRQLLQTACSRRQAEDLAKRYIAGEASARMELERHLARIGATADDARRIAFIRHMPEVELFERLGAMSDRRKAMLMRELTHRRAMAAQRRAQTPAPPDPTRHRAAVDDERLGALRPGRDGR